MITRPGGKRLKPILMFRINQRLLASELALLVQIAGQKNVIPALSTIRLKVEKVRGMTAQLLAFNGDVALFTSIEAEGEPWQGCIPARQLYDLVRLATNAEEIIFTPQSNVVQITWGRARHRLPLIQFSQFPDVHGPVAEAGVPVSVKTSDFVPALERVLPCASRDTSNKWVVQGVKLEAKEDQLKLIATNTHRLGVATVPCDGEIDVFVPLRAADLLPRMKAEEVGIWHDGKQIAFNFGPQTLIARMAAGIFPNWEAFMPEYLPLHVGFTTKEMIGALKRSEVTRDETFKTGVGLIRLGVVFVFGKEELVIDTKHSDVHGRSEESVEVTSNLNGDLVYMGINPDYIADFLRLAGPTTECFLKDGNSVLKMTDGSNFEYVVVPLRT